MLFSGFSFLFWFLPLCLVFYFLPQCFGGGRSPRVLLWQNAVLFFFSLLFYAWGEPLYVLLMLVTVGVNAALALRIARGRHRRAYLIAAVAFDVGLLLFFKYPPLLGLPAPHLPLGISFYTFQALSYVADVYLGRAEAEKNPFYVGLYVALFPQLVAGPIVRYTDVARELGRRTVTLDETYSGMLRFTVGLCKKAVLANTAAILADSLLAPDKLAAGAVSSLSVLLGVSAYMLQIYLDFSAYSDMAIGMGRMLGFHFKENFRYPYAANSITDFWRRWHISLSSFFRDYVYIPLGGNRCSRGRHILNLLVVWALTGFWHGASWNFVLWGLYFALFLILEKYVFRWNKTPHPALRVLRVAYTLVVVWFGWLIFRFTDMATMGHALACLFGGGAGFGDITARTSFLNYLFLLIVAVVACTPVAPFLAGKLSSLAARDNTIGRVARATLNVAVVLIPVALLALSVLALVGDSYNPFLYFRF